jgi:rhodanese-related sulfurtransferase
MPSFPELIDFALRHWVLVGAFILIVLTIFVEEYQLKKNKKHHLTPDDAVRLINHDNALTVDLRNETKFKNGHIIRSVNIAITGKDHQGVIQQLKKYQKRPLILCADMNQMTASLEAALKKENFDVYVLAGGIAAWTKAALPLTKQ